MSLRARLIIGVVALAFVGLLVAGGATYAELRSSLLERVDQQADAALPVVTRRAAGQGRHRAPRRGRQAGRPGARRTARRARRPGGPGGPRRPDAGLSSALYGEARDATGKVLGRVTPRLPAGETAPAAPQLPAELGAGERLTVDSDGGPRYRVVTERAPDGGS